MTERRDYDKHPVKHAPKHGFPCQMAWPETACGVRGSWHNAVRIEGVTCKNCLRVLKKKT